MSATEILHRMLDERGVNWRASLLNHSKDTHWQFARGEATFTEFEDGLTVIVITGVEWTAEETIESTLGRGTCHLEINTSMTAVVCDRCNYPMPHGTVLTDVRFCPNCGREVVDQ